MAGEILTGGLSQPQTSLSIATFEDLDYVNISHVVGMLSCTITLSFAVGRSNKMSYKIMSKEFGSTIWQQYTYGELDATGGGDKNVFFEVPYNRAWLVAIMPMQNIVRYINGSISVKGYSKMNLSESYEGSSKNKLLRICNNMKAIVRADTTAFANWDSIQNLSSSINLSLTTSPGVLMKSGQYIFGQN